MDCVKGQERLWIGVGICAIFPDTRSSIVWRIKELSIGIARKCDFRFGLETSLVFVLNERLLLCVQRVVRIIIGKCKIDLGLRVSWLYVAIVPRYKTQSVCDSFV